MSLHEIVLEETKPETEWVRGRALRKVSPTYRHGLTQLRIATALSIWAEGAGRGRVATEWRFRVGPPGEVVRPLVPDVAFVSFETLPQDAPDEDVEVPRLAPTVAVEVLSPDDRPLDVRDKVRVYLAAGSSAVIVLDPQRERATLYDAASPRGVDVAAILTHGALPGFAVAIATLFDRKRA
jgi:Uma2 family endonuclease